MAKKVRFPLKMADETNVSSLEELREHFDLERVLEYYNSERLTEWLEDRYYDDEADAVKNIASSSADLKKQLCAALGVAYPESPEEGIDPTMDHAACREDQSSKASPPKDPCGDGIALGDSDGAIQAAEPEAAKAQSNADSGCDPDAGSAEQNREQSDEECYEAPETTSGGTEIRSSEKAEANIPLKAVQCDTAERDPVEHIEPVEQGQAAAETELDQEHQRILALPEHERRYILALSGRERLHALALAEKRKQAAAAAARISSFGWHTVGLTVSGEVMPWTSFEDRSVQKWSDITAVSCSDFHIVGLRSDGTVVAAGSNKYGQCNVANWRGITAVAAGSVFTIGLKSDGTVVAAGSEREISSIKYWHNIVAIACNSFHAAGLRADGTVVTLRKGYNNSWDKVEDWRDIVAMACGSLCTIGLKADGTVVAAGDNKRGECNVKGWHDIVAVAGGLGYTVGLKLDGTVEAVGGNKFGQCNVRNMRNIVAIAPGDTYMLGVTPDGCVMCAGKDYDFKDIVDWRLFNSIDTLEQEIAEAKAAKRRQKIEALTREKEDLQTKLANLHGLFSGMRRKQIEARLEQIEEELKKAAL